MAQPESNKFDLAYLRMAKEWSKLSYSKRSQVGALIVKDGMIISDGYNGTPSGFENECEEYNEYRDEIKTKWYVLHAEANAILKVANSTNSCKGSTLYLTLSPCRECSKLVLQAGIKKLIYLEEYRNSEGLDFLNKAGVITKKINID